MASILGDIGNALAGGAFGEEKDAITIKIGRDKFAAFSDIGIFRSLSSLASEFSFTCQDRWIVDGLLWPIKPFEEVKIFIGEEVVAAGFIDELDPEISTEDRNLTFAGRSNTADLVDCSAITVGQLKNVNVNDICQKYVKDQFGIDVIVEADVGEPFAKWSPDEGETYYEMLQRAAKLRGLLLITDANGNFVITNRAGGTADASTPSISNLASQFDFKAALSGGGVQPAEVGLVQGQNILKARAHYDSSDRFSDYIVKGQAPGSNKTKGKKVSQVTASAKDSGVPRFRPMIIIAEGSITKATAQKRANWEATVRAARSSELSITVQGWRQTPGGDLWKPNILVPVTVPFLGLDAEMLVDSITLTKNETGTLAVLDLIRPDAYQPEPDISKDKDPQGKLGHKKKKDSELIKLLKSVF